MSVWDNMKMFRDFDDEREYDKEDIERAYRDGCKDGYRKAMEEVERRGYGERGGYGERDGGYGEREEGYGERRGVKGTGRYSRYR